MELSFLYKFFLHNFINPHPYEHKMNRLILGIDEAGRGPVLGPLVMAGVTLSLEAQKELASLGVKDSKLLTAEKRNELYPIIISNAASYKIIVIEPIRS